MCSSSTKRSEGSTKRSGPGITDRGGCGGRPSSRCCSYTRGPSSIGLRKGRGTPQPERPVRAPRDQDLAVGGEYEGTDDPLVPPEAAYLLHDRQIPELDGEIIPRRRQRLPVGEKATPTT